jgi:type II secretory pathway pseudopilin PulG
MNLRNLNKINIEDLKEIDWRQAKAHMANRPSLLINIVIIVITLAVVILTYQTNTKKIESLKGKLNNLEQRYNALQTFETLKKEQAEFIKQAPEIISDNRLIEILAEFAMKRNIQIASFSPSQEHANDYVRLTKVRINIQSENYADIIWFMHDIENSPYSIRLSEWVGLSNESKKSVFTSGSRQLTGSETQTEYIEATIEIESVGFNHV